MCTQHNLKSKLDKASTNMTENQFNNIYLMKKAFP